MALDLLQPLAEIFQLLAAMSYRGKGNTSGANRSGNVWGGFCAWGCFMGFRARPATLHEQQCIGFAMPVVSHFLQLLGYHSHVCVPIAHTCGHCTS